MAVPNATITKNIALASDKWKRTAFPDGTVPNAGPSAPPEFTTSKTSSSITATITNANGATSYRVRVDSGTAEDGLTKTGLTAETTYSFQVQGVNEFGSSDWTNPVIITTSASVGTFTAMVAEDFAAQTEGQNFNDPSGVWKPDSCLIDTTRALTGTKSMKIVLDSGQPPTTCGGDTYFGGRSTMPTTVPPGSIVWYSLWVYFPSTFSWGHVYEQGNAGDESDAAECGLSGNTDGGRNIKFMRMNGDNAGGARNYFMFPAHRRNVSQPTTHDVTLNSEPAFNLTEYSHPSAKLQLDAWNNMQFAILVSNTGAGWIRGWRGDFFVGEVTNIDTIPSTATAMTEWAIGTYFNGVHYTDGAAGRSEFWVDEIIVTTNADSGGTPTGVDSGGRAYIDPATRVGDL